MIRLAAPDIDGSDIDAVTAVLRTGQLVQGLRVDEFEKAIAARCGAAQAVAVNSCTSALHLALLAVGVRPGDAVAVAPFSWPATANVIELCGARRVFVYITSDTWTMDPEQLRTVLREQREIRAILPVHTFGGMADMPTLCAMAAEMGIPVVEDAACALGASLAGRVAGTYGALGCFSFHPRKAVTTGEGGVVVAMDTARLDVIRRLRNHGQDVTGPKPDFVEPGFNLRLTEFQAALGNAQLIKLDRLIAARRQCAAQYDALLGAAHVTRPAALPGCFHVFQSYVVLVSPNQVSERDAIILRMRERGVEAQVGTHHIPGLTYYRRKYRDQVDACPVSADVAARAIALPLHTQLTPDDLQHVTEALVSSF